MAKGRRRKDLALVYGVTDDGDGFHILRRRAQTDTVEVGTLRPLQEGKAVFGEVLRLTPRKKQPLLYDVSVEIPADEPTDMAPRSGPAKVTNDAYRSGWDAVWGRRGGRPSLAN